MIPQDEIYMKRALEEAGKALENGDVPVGAVIVKNGREIASGFNNREVRSDPSAHAEIEAIRQACTALGDWRLDGCTLYVTLEPCAMCTGACISARVSRIVFGAYDKKAGCCGSVADLTALHLDSEPEVFGGILQEECESVLKEFFKERRTGDGGDRLKDTQS